MQCGRSITSAALIAILLMSDMGCRVQQHLRGERAFDEDVAFLKRHVDVVILGKGPDGPRLVVVPRLQGRVMTSTTGGQWAPSFGWINRDLIASGRQQPHINAYGGEDRFWVGPEGGQYAIFFKPGDPFDLAHWQTPPFIDHEPYEVVFNNSREIRFRHSAHIVNYSGTRFDFDIERTVRLLDRSRSEKLLGVASLDGVDLVAYETDNRIINRGSRTWSRSGGLLSIWILGMFRHSDTTTVVVPFREGAASKKNPVVNDSYFGKVPADRLKIGDGVLFFRADGHYRSKIGVPPARARDIVGSYDPGQGLLTLVQFSLPERAADYVNSMWKLQDHPYGGDVVNSYNDGPPAPGVPPLGPFYELETSSPAKRLFPGATLSHVHRTFHLRGDRRRLDEISRRLLGASLARIERAF